MSSSLWAPLVSRVIQRFGNEACRGAVVDLQGWRGAFEDEHVVNLEIERGADRVGLFGVFDGHCGTAAAEFCRRELPSRLKELSDLSDESLEEMMLTLDRDFQRQHPDDQSGTTATIAITGPATAIGTHPVIVCHLGDSRCCDARGCLTRDHRPEDDSERERIEAAGGEVKWNRVDGNLAMSRALGDARYKNADHLDARRQKVIAVPTICRTTCDRHEWLLLCCDGVFERLTVDRVLARVGESLRTFARDPARVVNDLVEFALGSGSRDNLTAMLVLFENGQDYQQPDEYRSDPKGIGAETFVRAFHQYAAGKGVAEASSNAAPAPNALPSRTYFRKKRKAINTE